MTKCDVCGTHSDEIITYTLMAGTELSSRPAGSGIEVTVGRFTPVSVVACATCFSTKRRLKMRLLWSWVAGAILVGVAACLYGAAHPPGGDKDSPFLAGGAVVLASTLIPIYLLIQLYWNPAKALLHDQCEQKLVAAGHNHWLTPEDFAREQSKR